MIIVKLWGGMCNQMFQYAFGYALAKDKKDSLAFETDFYQRQPKNMGKRKVELTKYHVSNFSMMDRPDEVKLLENRYVNYIIRKFSHFYCHISKNFYFFKERLHKFYPMIPYASGKNNYYDGYWLTSRYFNKYRDELLREFMPSAQVIQAVEQRMKDAEAQESVAIHIRRGDYLNPGSLPQGVTMDALLKYYAKAIQYMKEHLDHPVFYIFSDDIPWCREFLKDHITDLQVPKEPAFEGALVDLFSIAKCKHGIMSPSTFSWWGNWLRTDQSGIVVLPAGDYANTYFAEDHWIQLEMM